MNYRVGYIKKFLRIKIAITLKTKHMNSIIKKYYLEPASTFSYYRIGTNGVDCWFEINNFIQHRCLSFEDFDLIKSL